MLCVLFNMWGNNTKSVISYSETKCGNCGAMLRVFVKDGIVIVAENANTESSKIYQVIKEEMKIE